MKKTLLVLILIVVIALALPFITIRTESAFICTHTGSIQGRTEWIFGIVTDEYYIRSDLESYSYNGIPLGSNQNWVSFKGTGYSLLNAPTVRAHGRPGPIVSLKTDQINEWARISSPGEISQAIERLRSRDENVVELQIETMLDKLLNRAPNK